MKSIFYTPAEARAHTRETVKKGKILLATELTELQSKQSNVACTK